MPFIHFQRSQLTLNRATGDVVKWEPYADNSTGRKLRTWVRALHTGEAFGFARPDRRRTRLSRRLFSRLDRLGDGLASLSFLAPHTERIYC